VQLALPVDPYSPGGQDWLASARDVLSSVQAGPGYGLNVYIEGPGAIIHDAVGAVLDAFPTMVRTWETCGVHWGW
jgi:hypothetical protein